MLSSPGVAKRIRSDLLTDFNCYAIVRLPHNVFAPYTDLKTNILFFERGGPTAEIFFCEPSLPEGYSLSKTKPLMSEWLEPLKQLIRQRKPTQTSWLVSRETLDENINLDIKNPHRRLTALESGGDLGVLANQFRMFADEADAIQADARTAIEAIQSAPHRLLGEVTLESDERTGPGYTPAISLQGVSAEDGITQPKTQIGKNPERYKVLRYGYLAYNPMRINIGSIGVVRSAEQEGITSPDYVVFTCKDGLLPEFVYHYLKSEAGLHEINQKTKGSVRFRLYYEQLATISIPMPLDIETQQNFVRACNRLEILRKTVTASGASVQECLSALTRTALLREASANAARQPVNAG